jgi:hypothetical protein
MSSWAIILCPPALGYAMHVQEKDYPEQWKKCLRNNAEAARTIATGGFDTVVMSARWLPLFQQMPRGLESPYPTDAATVADLEAGLVRSIDAVAPHVRRIIIIGPTPQLTAYPDRCIASGQLRECAMPRAEFDALSAKPMEFLRSLARRYQNVQVIDLAPFLCNAELCPVQIDGVTMYRDDDHVSQEAAKLFARGFVSRR